MADEDGGGGSGRSDVLFIFFVLLFLIAVWFFTGGPKRAGTTTSLFLSPPSLFSTSTSIGIPSVDMSGVYYDTSSSLGIDSTLNDSQSIALGLADLPTSPYAGKVHLQNASGSYSGNVAEEYITLYADSNNLQRVALTGWRLQSAITKRTAFFYQGTETYTPSSGSANESIVLNPGDYAIVSSGHSPLGVSFKENKCTGYLSQFQNFNPNLSGRCPLPIDEASEITSQNQAVVDRSCTEYLQSMSSCQTAINPPSSLSDSCRSLITERLTYSGCISKHRNDIDFKGVQWRIYFNASEKLWRDNREVLTLLDGEGKLVDSIVF